MCRHAGICKLVSQAGGTTISTSEFAVLDRCDPELRETLESIEKQMELNRSLPRVALGEARRFLEVLTEQIDLFHNVLPIVPARGKEPEDLNGRIKRLRLLDHIPKELSPTFHALRRLGNKGAHKTERGERPPTLEEARVALRYSKKLARWFRDEVICQVESTKSESPPPPPPLPPPPPAPTECMLTVSPTTLVGLGISTLSWSTENAKSVTIDPILGPVTPNKSDARSVLVSQTTTFTITAEGLAGKVIRRATVTVADAERPPPDPGKLRRRAALAGIGVFLFVVFLSQLIPSAQRSQTDVSEARVADQGQAITHTELPLRVVQPPSLRIERFPEPVTMMVLPPPAEDVVYESSVPGATAKGTELHGGDQVLAIGRTVDEVGDGWVELSDENFLKEAYLVRNEPDTNAPQPEQQAALPPEREPEALPREAEPSTRESEPVAREPKEAPLRATPSVGPIVGSVSGFNGTWNCLILQLSSTEVVEGGTVVVELPGRLLRARVQSVNGDKACAEPATAPPDDVAGKTVRLALERD